MRVYMRIFSSYVGADTLIKLLLEKSTMELITNELITANELATRLRVSQEMVKGWARKGKIPIYRLGHKTLRFDYVDVLASLKKQHCEMGVNHDG